jgi:endonuclease-8
VPEGDTIFRTARALQQGLAGRKITGFETAYAPLASVHDQSPVTGRIIERVESRGKWLLIHFSGDLILATHMLMSGSWHIYRVGERWQRARSHMRVVLGTDDLLAVAFDVPVARIGNVFKSEICFACGVNPFRKVASLRAQEIECLIETARRFLAANVADGAGDAIVTYTGGRRTTDSGDPAARLWVYHRTGSACRRCGTAILMRKQGPGARSTFWCPECQKLSSSSTVTV